jgi:DNA-binding NarL/FixJ family response regulator
MARPKPVHGSSPSNIIVAAARGIQRDALVSLLRAQPHLTLAAVADDAAALHRLLQEELARTSLVHPTAAVIDAGLRGALLPDLIRSLRQEFPAVRCIVLADTANQCTICLAAGAQAALLKGCLGEHLLAAIGR